MHILNILKCRNSQQDKLPMLYVVSNYCIADSLYMPLMMAPINKLDDVNIIDLKLEKINTFVDKYINLRTLQSKSVTQSSIRDAIYELIKELRKSSSDDMDSILCNRLDLSLDDNIFVSKKFSSSYMHYFHARVRYYLKSNGSEFCNLLRSRKQTSFVLYQIIKETDDLPKELSNNSSLYMYSLVNYCLIRRSEITNFDNMDIKQRLLRLKQEEYLLDVEDETFYGELDFWQKRERNLYQIVEKLWI